MIIYISPNPTWYFKMTYSNVTYCNILIPVNNLAFCCVTFTLMKLLRAIHLGCSLWVYSSSTLWFALVLNYWLWNGNPLPQPWKKLQLIHVYWLGIFHWIYWFYMDGQATGAGDCVLLVGVWSQWLDGPDTGHCMDDTLIEPDIDIPSITHTHTTTTACLPIPMILPLALLSLLAWCSGCSTHVLLILAMDIGCGDVCC